MFFNVEYAQQGQRKYARAMLNPCRYKSVSPEMMGHLLINGNKRAILDRDMLAWTSCSLLWITPSFTSESMSSETTCI